MSEEIPLAADTSVADIVTELIKTQQALTDAWKLLGRCDLAFELITTAQRISTAKRTARQLRNEIEKASTT